MVSSRPEERAEAELLLEGRPRTAHPLERRELIVELIVSASFLAIAVAMGLGLESTAGWNVGQAVVLVLLFAVAIRVQLDVGAGLTVPVQLVFVPMLLLLPTPWVPLLTAAGYLLGKLPDYLHGQHWTRAFLVPGNAAFAIGPALVLVAGDAQTPDWSDWPVYLAAVLAQLATDVGVGMLREWAGRGIPPRQQLEFFSWIVLIDVVLSPLGLLAAFASVQIDYAFLLLVPPAVLIFFFAQERSGRIRSVLRLYEAEHEAVRSREALIAGASHEILTHLSVVVGLSRHIGRLDGARQAEALRTMDRELLLLRHVGRQFVDFTRLKSGRPPTVRLRDVDVRPVLATVCGAFDQRARVALRDGPDVVARADPDRLEQVVMALVDNAVRHGPHGGLVEVAARQAGAMVEVDVLDRGRGIHPEMFEEQRRGHGADEGAGIGLFVSRALVEAQGGTLRAAEREGGGSVLTLALPAGR